MIPATMLLFGFSHNLFVNNVAYVDILVKTSYSPNVNYRQFDYNITFDNHAMGQKEVQIIVTIKNRVIIQITYDGKLY